MTGRLMSGSCARGRDDHVTFEEARAQFPVFERFAYLNAGSFGPLATSVVDAMLPNSGALSRKGA